MTDSLRLDKLETKKEQNPGLLRPTMRPQRDYTDSRLWTTL